MTRALVPAAVGVAAGIVAALILTRFVASFLFGIQPYDAVSFAAGGVLLMIGVAVASYIPARRAAAVDPVTALRAT